MMFFPIILIEQSNMVSNNSPEKLTLKTSTSHKSSQSDGLFEVKVFSPRRMNRMGFPNSRDVIPANFLCHYILKTLHEIALRGHDMEMSMINSASYRLFRICGSMLKNRDGSVAILQGLSHEIFEVFKFPKQIPRD